MRNREITGMIAVGFGTYLRPEEIVVIGPHSGNMPDGPQVIDATGGRPARTIICLRSGVSVYSSLTMRVLIQRLNPEEKKKNPAGSRVRGIVAQQSLFADHSVNEGEESLVLGMEPDEVK